MKTIKLLTIGNSFAENALTFLEAMANSTSDIRIQAGSANLGGCSLEKHWNLALYTSKHPEYKTYRLWVNPDGTPRETTLQEALSAEPWDVVTLQQVSSKSWRRETFQPYLGLLHDLVKQRASQAEIFLHQTWAYRSDAPFFPQHSLTQELMFERIRAAYAHFSAELGCCVLPSGEAVQTVRRAPGRTFSWPEPDFDYQHAEAPALPGQAHSLAVGWNWAINSSPDGIPEMRLDAIHLNRAGCYLIGCVWFECLTGVDVRSLAFIPAELDPEYAAFLRTVAHDVARVYVKAR